MLFASLSLWLLAAPDPVAVGLVRRATREYNAAAFGPAFLDYQAAYEVEPIPDLLFDMGQAQRGLHHWERALSLFQRYLGLQPSARGRARAERLIAQMEERLREAPPAAAEAVAAPDPTPAGTPPVQAAETAPQPSLSLVPAEPLAPTRPPTGHGAPAGAWILGTVGAVSLLGAAGLGVAVLLQPDHASGNPPLHSLTYGHLQAVQTEGTAGLVLAAAGAVLLGSGLAWGLAAP